MDCNSKPINCQSSSKLEEEIIIETEPVGYNKFFTFRRYTDFVSDEEVIVRCIDNFLND